MHVNCTGTPYPPPDNSHVSGNPDDNFDVSSRLIELEELYVTKQTWKDLYGRTGIKKGYNGLFLEKAVTESYAKLAATTTDADYDVAAQQFQFILASAQKEAKHSFEDTYYASADVALLSDAFVDNAAELLLKRLKEPIREVKETFTPAALIKNQPVLLIPSGALTGFNDSPMLKASLDEYVKQGGTLIVLSQKHGYDYASIPTPDGKPITGYGWEEDQNCFADSVAIESWHQMLSGQSRSTPTLNVDGYFTGYPVNSTVLLRRTANGQPAMLMYEHGAGRVIVTSMYSDWAYGHGQTSQEEITLMRDMLSWAKKPAVLPEVRPGEAITVPVTLTNSTASDAASIKLQIWNPDRSSLMSELSVSLAISAGQSLTSNVDWHSPPNPALGIYHIDYLLLDSSGTVIQPQAETDSGRFVVSNPPQTGTVKKDIWLTITSPNQQVFFGEPFAYAFHIFNNTATNRNLTLKTLLPHTGRTHEYQVTATANGETVVSGTDLFIDWNFIETLHAHLYDENNVEVGSYMLTFKGLFPQVTVTTAPAKTLYTRGEPVNISVNLGNRQALASTVKLNVTVTDPANSIIFSSSTDVLLPASGQDSRSFSFFLPQTAQGGVYTVSSAVLDMNGEKVGGDSASFEIPLRLVTITPGFPAGWQAGANQLSFSLANQGIIPVTTGLLSALLTDPDSAAVASASQPFTLDAGQAKNLDLSLVIPPLKFGAYTLAYNQGDATGPGRNSLVPLANSVAITTSFDKPSYRIRETANLTVSLANTGRFNLENATVTVTVPDAGFADTRIMNLGQGQSFSLQAVIPLPEAMTAGQHAVTVTMTLPGGAVMTKAAAIIIPEALLTPGTLASRDFTAGATVKLPLTNTGGKDTTAEYTVELYDSTYVKLATASATASISAGSTIFMELPLPQELKAALYHIQSRHADLKDNKNVYGFERVTVKGVDAVLKTSTSKLWYLPTETLNASTAITLNNGELTNATLNLKLLTTSANQTVAGFNWWDKGWRYRQQVVINTGNAERENSPVSVAINFSDEFARSGKPGTFDENSLRVIEYDADGKVLREVPSQLDKAADYNAATSAKGSVFWIMYGIIPAGSVKRYAVYFDTVENGVKASAGYPVVAATLDNTSKFWKTDGVYLKWGGYGYRYEMSDIVTDLRFDDNGNNDPTDDFDRLQDYSAFGGQWYGFLGSGYFTGFGASTGAMSRQGAVFAEMSLGKATFRYYKGNKRWIECNGAVDFLFDFGSIFDYVKSGNKPEKNIVSGSSFENYYSSTTQPGYLAYRSSSSNLILGGIAINASNYSCDNRLDPAYDRILSFNDSSTNSAARIYWYSDTTGNYQGIGKLSESLLNKPNYIQLPTEIYDADASEAVVWSIDIPVSLSQSKNVPVEINLQGLPSGKLYLKSTLVSGLNQSIAQDVQPVYLVNGNTLLVFNADKKLYKPGEAVTIFGEVRNLSTVTAPNLALVLKSKSAGTEQSLVAETCSLTAGGSYPFTLTTTAGAEGRVVLAGTVTQNGVTQIEIADQYEVASPKVAAAFTAPEIAGNDPFTTTLELKNSGKVEAVITVGKSFDTQHETVTIPAGQTRLLQYSRQIAADTSDSFTLSGDLTQTLSKAIKYGPAITFAVAPQALYSEGKIALPLTVTNSGLIDSQFTVNYQLTQGANSLSQQAKSYFLAKGSSSSDSLSYDLPEGSYQLAATGQNPAASAAASFQVRKETKADLTLAVGAQSAGLLPATVNVTNLGYLPVEGSVRFALIANDGAIAWTTDQEVVLPQALLPAPHNLAFSVNLAPLKPGSYTIKAELLDACNRQLAYQSAPFNLLGPTIAISQLPQDRTVPAGGSSDFIFKVKNSGNQEGQFDLSFKADDLINVTRSEWLKPGAEKELSFTLQAAGDLDEKDYFASYNLKSGTGTQAVLNEQGTVKYHLQGLNLAVTALLDRQAYNDGDSASFTLNVTQQDAGAAPNLFARVNYNGYNEKQSFTLNGSQTVVFNVPLTQITGEKLFYGIYTESGRSIHLNTIYVRKADAALTIATDKQVYNPGETVIATISGTAAGDLTLTGPGDFTTSFAYSGSDTRSFTLPAAMTAGTYAIKAQLKTAAAEQINATYPIDVAGIQVKVKEALLDKAKYTAIDTMRLNLTIESNRDIPATVKTWIVDPAGTYTEAGSGAAALTAAAPLLTTLDAQLSTASLGIHKLVYGIYHGDLLLASGAKAFDIGEVVLLGLVTDRTDYPEVTMPVSVKVDLYGTTAAGIELFLDGTSINSDSVTLSGAGLYTFVIPATSLTPGFHNLKAVLSSGGLTSSRESRFTFGSTLPDLTARVAALPVSGSKMKLSVTVSNQGKTAAGESRAALFDGDPAKGGQQLALLSVPAIAAGNSATLPFEWNILGQSGQHVLYVQADSDNSVIEFIEMNNTALTAVSLPSVTLAVTAGKSAYGANEVAALTVDIANLTAGLPLENSTLKLRLTSPSGLIIDLPERNIGIIPQSTAMSFAEIWNSGITAPADITVTARLVSGAAELASATGSFAITPTVSLTGSIAPVVTEIPQESMLEALYNVSNSGNVPLDGKLQVIIRDPQNGTSKYTQVITLQLPVSGNKAGAFTLPLTGLEIKSYDLFLGFISATSDISVALSQFTIKDTIPPVLTVSTLSDGSYTNQEALNVSGTVHDNSGSAQVEINSASVPVAADGSFSQALLLNKPDNSVEVKAIDMAGNKAVDTRSIHFDKTAPTLTIDAPADNSKTAVSPIEVKGSVDETSTVTVQLNGVSQPVVMDGNRFSVAITPESRWNTIEITAKDLAGNPNSQKRSVLFDDQKPSLAITEPDQDIRTNKNSMTISGKASDPYSAVGVTVAIDGAILTPQMTGDSFSQIVTFTDEKLYPVVVTASNEVGTQVSAQRNIIFDKTPPNLTIDPVVSPTNVASQVVTGTREEGTTVAISCTTAIVGPVEYPAATTWRAPVSDLVQGENRLQAEACDLAGNRGTAIATIRYVPKAPEVTISAAPNQLWPPNKKLVQVRISGNVSTFGSDVKEVTISVADEYGKYNIQGLRFGDTVLLEAWREGNDMDGRVYTITAVVTDMAGNKTTQATTVIVPHDMGK